MLVPILNLALAEISILILITFALRAMDYKDNLKLKKRHRQLTLAQYVKRRNGVALGGKGALGKMFKRSFGSGTFEGFWRYWNPLWGYFLAKWFFIPLKNFLPTALAVMITFAISGALHDLAVILLTKKISYLITLWFSVMGVFLVLLTSLNVNYEKAHFIVRATINLSIIVLSYLLASQIGSRI